MDEKCKQAAMDEKREQAAVGEKREQAAIDDKCEQAAIDDKCEQAAMDDKREQAAMDDKREQVAMDDKREQAAMDDKWEVAAMDDECEQAAMDDEREHAAMDDERKQAAMDDECEQAAMDDECEQAAMDDECQQAAMDDKQENAAMDDKREKADRDDKQEKALPSSSPNQQLLSIDEEIWLMAEERAQEILCTIQPNVVSEDDRKGVIDFLQSLIRGYCGVEVFPFGSVPLKTYLPDGDIDLTALSHDSEEEDLAQAVCNLLETGDDPEYQVKDIQHIPAQVQVVKCTVKNIAVDISFNQMAGLFALRFLEQVDQLVGKNHLFKRSIILVKAWCYYESRILGAHHGLLSTYAVETLVLYIINRFHSLARGPLEILYRFLDYYSTFDWENDYASIYGPKALSSLPEVAEISENDQGEFLLRKEFLRNYRDMCTASVKTSDTMTHEFSTKHLNILDPLRNDNNLGRSVSKANLHRIRFALSFGVRKLKEILTLPGEDMGGALEKFFTNTIERNGKGQRPDVEVPVATFGTGKCEESVLRGDCESYYGGLRYVQLYRNYAMPHTAYPSSPSSPSQANMYVSTQQNWCTYYQTCNDVYLPGQTLYHPNASQVTYGLEESGRSRGTGTYIPDMAHSHNVYRDMRLRATRPRRFTPSNQSHCLSPRSPQVQQLTEVNSETDMESGKQKPFELSNEEFPLLPGICTTSPSEAKQLAQLTVQGQSSPSLNCSLSEFPPLPNIRKTSLSEAEQTAQLTVQAQISPSVNYFLSEFPPLPSIRKTNPSEAEETAQLTVQAQGSPSVNYLLSDFPPLPSLRKTSSEAKNSAQLTVQAKSPPSTNCLLSEFPLLPCTRKKSPSSELNIEFGSCKISDSLTELSLTTKDEKEHSAASSSDGTMLDVSKDEMKSKEESSRVDEKMDGDEKKD